MAQVEVFTNLCTSIPKAIRSGYKPACSCGWEANVSYGSQREADDAWAITHRATAGVEHSHPSDGIFVELVPPETVDPDRPRVDAVGPWQRTPPPSNPALRRGDEGTSIV
jgi:hypothetical protein